MLQHGDFLIHQKWFKKLLEQTEACIKNWHKEHPDQPGIPIDQLRGITGCPERILELLMDELTNKGYQTSGQAIAHPSHRLSLPDEIKAVAQSIMTQLEKAGLNPPNKSELASTAADDQAVKFLIRSGQLIELDPKIVITSSVLDAAIQSVSQFITSHGQATASDLRQHLDSTRKIVMPLLEHMDKLGVTRRNENYRSLV